MDVAKFPSRQWPNRSILAFITYSTNVMLEFLRVRRCVYRLSHDGAVHGSLS